MIRLSGFSVEGYKSFGKETPIIYIAPITIILGRNNSGKSALCRAPLFFSHPLQTNEGWEPFPLEIQGIDFGANLIDICFNQQISGLKARLFFEHDSIRSVKIGGAAIPEKGYRQVINELEIEDKINPFVAESVLEWTDAQEILSRYSPLQEIPSGIRWLRGIREIPSRKYKYIGKLGRIESSGKHAPLLLAYSKLSSDDGLFETVRDWFQKYLLSDLNINTGEGSFLRENAFSVMVKHKSQSLFSNIADAGEGISQVLPVVVAMKALQFHKPPKLYIIEQPELHLHPYAHAAVAELMIETAEKKSDCHLLIETHSESFVLRIRRALAEQRLSPEQVKIYFVEENRDRHEGSIVKAIELNDRGTPDWWPEGIFAEAHQEFKAIRKALALRERKT